MCIRDSSNEVNYCNDFFFKYALGSEDEDSAYIRNTIIERVTGIHPKESIVLNPNLDPTLLEMCIRDRLYYNALTVSNGVEPKAFKQEELQKWEYPKEIKFPNSK